MTRVRAFIRIENSENINDLFNIAIETRDAFTFKHIPLREGYELHIPDTRDCIADDIRDWCQRNGCSYSMGDNQYPDFDGELT